MRSTVATIAPASTIGEERYVTAGGQRIRVNVRAGNRRAAGALQRHRRQPGGARSAGGAAGSDHGGPIRRSRHRRIAHIRLLPYGFPYLAWVLGRVLTKLGIGVVDVLGLSWGGALAQQFAFQNPRRCRRLVLVATGTGALMVPAHPRVLAKMLTPRRFSDPDYAASIAGELYGGTVRAHGDDVARLFVRQLHAGSKIGYLHQLLAGAVWTSLFALPAVRQETLIVAGTDDPIIPVVNARIMHALLPHSRLHLHSRRAYRPRAQRGRTRARRSTSS